MSTFEFKVPGTDFILKSNTIYKVTSKLDPNAPDGFVKEKTTKIIHPDITTSVGAPWDDSMESWDTGFYPASKCLRGLRDEEKKAVIDVLRENLVEPVEEIKGKGKLDHTKDNDYFDNFRIPLGTSVVFNTSDPIERLQLYFAVLGKNLAPKENENHPNFGKAQFCVVNNEEAVSAREERNFENTEAIGLFYGLLNSDKKKLFSILDYLNIVNSDKTDPKTLTTAFTSHLQDKSPSGYQNSKIFIDTYKKFDSEKGAEELYLYKLLKELYRKNIVKVIRGTVYLDDIDLGNSFKLAAEKANLSPEISKQIIELSQNN